MGARRHGHRDALGMGCGGRPGPRHARRGAARMAPAAGRCGGADPYAPGPLGADEPVRRTAPRGPETRALASGRVQLKAETKEPYKSNWERLVNGVFNDQSALRRGRTITASGRHS